MKKLLVLVTAVVVALGVAACGALTIEKMVTKEVLEEAVCKLAEDMKQQEVFAYTNLYGITWSAGTYARHAVFHKVMGDDYFEGLYDSLAANFGDPEDYYVKKGAKKKFRVLYEKIMQVARESLRDPETLKAFYLLHKQQGIELLHRYEIAEGVREELKYMLPYFNGTLDPIIALLCQFRLEFEQSGRRGDLIEFEKELRLQGLNTRNFNYYEWSLRRKAEGGQDLVDAWAWIIADLIESI